jgi:hypothetical protein
MLDDRLVPGNDAETSTLAAPLKAHIGPFS